MESDDLSLLDISGEDDSLLLPPEVKKNDVSSLSTVFSCSPLQIPGPNRSVKTPLLSPIGEDTKVELSSHRESANKENMNANRSEVPKLSVERQQMKKKKKGGGFNLRKSLAWDRAFFTEEGVLDPLELSMICGNAGKSGGDLLSVIHEHGGESSTDGSQNLSTLEENSSKELPAHTLSEDRTGGALIGKNSSPARGNTASAGKRKVLSTHDGNRTGTKRSGCPRPVASSSVKRPANVNTRKPAATKEIKISKVPAPKPDSSVLSATAKSSKLGASTSKKNHIPQPGVSAKRNIGPSGSSNINRTAPNKSKSGTVSRTVAAKSSLRQARRNVVSSEIKSSTNARLPHVKKANYGSKINSGSAVPASRHTEVGDTLNLNSGPALPASEHGVNKYDGGSNNIATSSQCLPPRGGSTHYPQLPTAKPSGLRMPSPSLGFFNQSKAGGSRGLLPKSNQVHTVLESNVPCIRNLGASNTISRRAISGDSKKPETADSVTASLNTQVPGSVEEPSIPSSVKPDSQEKTSSDLLLKDAWKVEENEQSNSTILSNSMNQQKLQEPCNNVDEQSLQHAAPSKTEKISPAEDHELQTNTDGVLFQNGSSRSREDSDDEGVANVNPVSIDPSGLELGNPDITSKNGPPGPVGGLLTHDMPNIQVLGDKQFKSQVTSSESENRDIDGQSTKDTLIGLDNGSRHVIDGNEKVELNPCNDQILKDDKRLHINLDGFSDECKSSTEFQNCSGAEIADSGPEIGGGCELGSFQDLSCFSKEEEARDTVIVVDNLHRKPQAGDAQVQSVDNKLAVGNGNDDLFPSPSDNKCVKSADDVNGILVDSSWTESKSFNTLCAGPPLGCGFGVAETVDRQHGDDIDSGFIDTQFTNPLGPATLEDSKTMSKDQLTSGAVTSSIEVEKNKGVFNISAMNEHKDVEYNQCNVLEIHRPSNFVSDHGNGTKQTTLTMHNGWLSNMPTVNNQFIVENQIPECYDYNKLTFKEATHEEVRDSNTFNSAYVNPAVNISGRRESGGNLPTVNNQSMVENQIPECYDYNELTLKEATHEEVRDSNNFSSAYVSRDVKISGRRESESNLPTVNNQSMVENQIPECYDYNELTLTLTTHEEVRDSNAVNSVYVSPDVKSLGRGELGSPNILHQCEQKEQEKEIVVVNNKIEKMLDAQLQGLGESLLCDSCNDSFNASTLKYTSPVGVDDVCEQSSVAHSEVNSFDLVAAQDSLHAQGLYLNDKLILSNCEDLHEKNCESTMDVVLEHSGTCRNESKYSVLSGQGTTIVKNDGIDEDQNAGNPPEEDEKQRFDVNEPIKCEFDMTCRRYDGDEVCCSAHSSGSDMSLETNEDQASEMENTCHSKSFELLNEDVGFPVNTNKTSSIVQSLEVDASKSDALSEEFEYSIPQTKGTPINDLRHELENTMFPTEDKQATTSSSGSVYQNLDVEALKTEVHLGEAETSIFQENGDENSEMQHELEAEDKDATNNLKSGNDKKQADLVIKPPPNAVPFSDEWLAALEAAGEEILTMKSGAVQHSPPEKSQPEPGPWSPVKKKKNQEIGPYDCTKYKNARTNSPSSH